MENSNRHNCWKNDNLQVQRMRERRKQKKRRSNYLQSSTKCHSIFLTLHACSHFEGLRERLNTFLLLTPTMKNFNEICTLENAAELETNNALKLGSIRRITCSIMRERSVKRIFRSAVNKTLTHFNN